MLRKQAIWAADRLGVGDALRRAVQADSTKLSAQSTADEQGMLAVMAARLGPHSNAIDVGAHRGTVLRHLLRCAPDGSHIAFEPLPALAAHLRTAFPGVDVRCSAAFDKGGTSSFVHVTSNPEYSGLRARTMPSRAGGTELIEVALEPIDEVLPSGYVPSLIKIDVEGAELQVMRGAIETISRHRPLVIFEHGIGGADHYGATSEQIHDLLCGEARLRIYNLQGRGPYSRDEFSDLFDRPIWNFMAS